MNARYESLVRGMAAATDRVLLLGDTGLRETRAHRRWRSTRGSRKHRARRRAGLVPAVRKPGRASYCVRGWL